MAAELAYAAVVEFQATCEAKMREQSQNEGGYNPKQNPAYYLDALITVINQSHKDFLIKRHLKGKQPLSKVDLWLWFIEDLLHLAKAKRAPHMAVAVLMILCGFRSFKVAMLYWYLDQSREQQDDSTFRRSKPRFMDELEERYDPFTEVRRVQKNERRYVKEVSVKEYGRMFEEWLQQLTPLYPTCVLTGNSAIDCETLEQEYITGNIAQYPDNEERIKQHMIQCPKCLRKLLSAAGFADWTESFAPPAITLPGSNSDESPSDRTKPQQLPAPMLALLKTRLRRSSMRRQKLPLESLVVAVDNGRPKKIRLNQEIHMHVKAGNSLIRISGKHWWQRVPLDSHLISWDESLAGRTVRFRTVLKERPLEFLLHYQLDLKGATVDVRYSNGQPDRVLQLAPLPLQLAKGGALLAVSFAVLLLCTTIASWSRGKGSKLTDNSNANFGRAATGRGADNIIANSNAREGLITSSKNVRHPRSQGKPTRANPTVDRKNSSAKPFAIESKLRGIAAKGKTVRREGADLYPAGVRSRGNRSFWSDFTRKVRDLTTPVVKAAKPFIKRAGSAISTASKPAPVGESRRGLSGIDLAAAMDASSPTLLASPAGGFADVVQATLNPPATNTADLTSHPLAPAPSAFVTLTGIVTDTNDSPVPFAIVSFRARRPGESPVRMFSRAQIAVVCDAAGEFRVRYTTAEMYDLMVERTGFVPASEVGIRVARDSRSAPRLHIQLQREKGPNEELLDRVDQRRHAKSASSTF